MNENNIYNLSSLPDCASSTGTGEFIEIFRRYVVLPLFGLVDIIGFAGNLLVIIVIAGYSSMQNSTNILILSLALADLSFIICCVPFTAMVYVVDSWPLPDFFCKIWNFTTYLSAYCSVYTLVLMSLDRFLAVVFPLRSRVWRTTKNTIIAVIITWIILILANLPLALYTKALYWVENDGGSTCKRKMCHFTWTAIFEGDIIRGINVENSKIFYTIFFALGYAVPLALICIFYSVLLKELLCGRVSKMSKSAESHKGKRKATKLVIIVISVFAACWLPVQTIFMLQSYIGGHYELYLLIGNVLAYANSCVNPILYAFFSDTFRTGFASLICLDKSKMRSVRYESNADRTEMLRLDNNTIRKKMSTARESPQRNSNNDRRSRKSLQKEVAFVESVCVHPLTQYTPENNDQRIE